MPRAQPEVDSSSSHPPHLLKRRQACHQCRRRKLKCDAQKPCSPCVKSHRFASYSNPGLLQTGPECTYDDLTSTPVVKPRTKYQILENKIRELESLVGQQSKEKESPSAGPSASTLDPSVASTETPRDNDPLDVPNILDPLLFPSLEQLSAMSELQTIDSPSDHPGQQLVISGWPTRLPKPDLFYHLVDVFFTCYPHAHYILHRPSFMVSLALPPKSPDFPHVSLLHAICAYAGVFSYLIKPPTAGDLEKIYRDFIFGDRRRPDSKEESFAEMHAKWAEETASQASVMGFNMLECVQTLVILSSFYASQGRWVELWSTLGDALRIAVPLGLNTRSGFRGDGTAHSSDSPETLLPNPANCVEEEARVNLFWVAYANERLSEAPGSWAMCLDDQDIHQLLPGGLSHFEAGHDIQGARQSLGLPDVLLQHPPELTDGFSLYIKATILISKTKSFNLRIRHKYPDATDVREVPEFYELEQLIASFRKSFPQQYNSPISQTARGLDIHVYATHLISQFAIILLHDKHANLYSPNCQSTRKLVAAARAILDLMYTVCSTSYDITRLPSICVQCWGRSASVLIRLYKLEISRGNQEEALAIDIEIQSIRFVLNQMGSRLPMALKYDKAIDFELETECGQIVRVYSVSQQGPSPEGKANTWTPAGVSVRLGSRSKWAPETMVNAAGQLQSLLPSSFGSYPEINTTDPSYSLSHSLSALDTLGHPSTGTF
ncbi:fungal specific transcription factor domain protein [Rhizoctonia solani 123E]|uniref:Fungal specific transcription factor domain protein n=1 Tax=Rhizoctonia solani 123E TaxID=1423351 RepID=A0A074RYK5_9AGAM|nr:fungal specific transcription factor domain protein [Rhizoctonia solani 123E]